MFELWKLHRSRDKALKEIKNKLDEAKKTKDKERVQELLFEEQSDIDEFLEWEATIRSRKLAKKAERFDLPIPEWKRCSFSGDYYLTQESRYELRKRIIEESNNRRVRFTQWGSIIISLISASTAFIAVYLALLSHKH